MKKIKLFKRKRNENMVHFMERVGDELESGRNVDTPGGPLCKTCAPSTGYDFDEVGTVGAPCYNCGGYTE